MSLKNKTGFFISLPGLVWLTLLFLIPTLIIVAYSFLTPGTYGGATFPLSLKSYSTMLSNPGFWLLLWKTTYISVIATAITLFLALPISYYIATSKNKNFLLMLIIIPFWTNFLVRVFGWMVVLGRNGLVSWLLNFLKITENPESFMYKPGTVILVIVYMYLPYMILPIYSSIEKFDFSLLEAAMDLGSTRIKALWKVMLPAIKGGIIAGIILVLIPALGSYAIPELVGGKNGAMLGNLIARQLTVARNWPSSSAISMIFLLISALGLLFYLRIANIQYKRQKTYEDYINNSGENL
ncbi:MAG: ABC transporter permease [Kosmotogaceae bacterium]